MTLVIAVALADVALVAADTRLNLGLRDGTRGYHDRGPLTIDFPDGDSLAFGDERRKLRRTPSGWAAGAGEVIALEAMLHALAATPDSSLTAVAARVSAARARTVARIEEHLPTPRDAVDRTTLVWTRDRGAAFDLLGVRFDGRPAFGTAQYVVLTPPDLAPVVHTAVDAALRAGLQRADAAQSLPALVRSVADAFTTVSAHASTVGRRVEIGLEVRAAARVSTFYVADDAPILATDTDGVLGGKLRPT